MDELIRPHPGCLVLPLVTDKPEEKCGCGHDHGEGMPAGMDGMY